MLLLFLIKWYYLANNKDLKVDITEFNNTLPHKHYRMLCTILMKFMQQHATEC